MFRSVALVLGLVLACTAAADIVDCFERCPADDNSPVLIAVPYNCKLYATCIMGKPIIGFCRGDDLFDAVTKKCVPADKASCKECDLKFKPLFEVYNNISQRCIDNSVTPVSCPSDISDDKLVAHPDDCHLFYYCSSPDFPAICRDCPANLHFNPVKKVCDHPDVAGCASNALKPFSALFAPAASKVHPFIRMLTPLRISAKQSEIVCDQENGVLADLRPNPKDCSKYYVCDWGYLISMDCPPGLHYDAPLKACILPEDARCEVEAVASLFVEADDVVPTQAPEVTTPAPPVEPPVKCKTTSDDDYVELHPDPESCEFFYICSWGIPHRTPCPIGMHFNPNLLVCDRPEDAGCVV